MTGMGELALASALILGLLRRMAFTFGFFLSLVIWSVPEGFGGPYGPGSTGIGTGNVHALVFVFLPLINATFGQGGPRRTTQLRGSGSGGEGLPR